MLLCTTRETLVNTLYLAPSLPLLLDLPPGAVPLILRVVKKAGRYGRKRWKADNMTRLLQSNFTNLNRTGAPNGVDLALEWL